MLSVPRTCYTELEFFPRHTHRLHLLPLLPFQTALRLLRPHLPTIHKAKVLLSSSTQSRTYAVSFSFNQSRANRKLKPKGIFLPRLASVACFPALDANCIVLFRVLIGARRYPSFLCAFHGYGFTTALRNRPISRGVKPWSNRLVCSRK